MNTWHRVVRLLPAIVLAIAAAACGGGSTGGDGSMDGTSHPDAMGGDGSSHDGTADVGDANGGMDTGLGDATPGDGSPGGDSETDTGPADTGPPVDAGFSDASTNGPMSLQPGGTVSQSSRYRLVGATVYGGAHDVSPSSSRYIMREGIVGRAATSP